MPFEEEAGDCADGSDQDTRMSCWVIPFVQRKTCFCRGRPLELRTLGDFRGEARGYTDVGEQQNGWAI